MNISVSSLFFIILLFEGCALSASGPRFTIAERSQDAATVYVYRPYRFTGGGGAPLIKVDYEDVSVLRNNGHTYFFLKPGTYLISPDYTSFWSRGVKYAQVLTVESGKEYFLKTETNHMPLSFRQTDFRVTEVSREQAMKEILETRFIGREKAMFEARCNWFLVPISIDGTECKTIKGICD